MIKIKNLINSINTNWKSFLDEESKKDYFINLINTLNEQYSNFEIYPEVNNIFRCFNFFNIEDTKLIILGQDPYHIKDMADGLAFSTKLNICPKSLNNIFNEIYNDFGIKRDKYDLEDIAKQEVLLLNTILTVQKNMPLSHKNIGWETFTKNLLNWISKRNNKIIYLLMGNNAISYSNYINNSIFIIKTSHPSPFSYHKSLKNSKTFKMINDLLIANKLTPIKW